jgi:3-hydroxyacyl-[acyl-carrier-protein] dehydratase
MSTPAAPALPAAPSAPSEADEIDQLREALKRCPPGTFEAACEFRRTRRPEFLDPVIVGVIGRYVERDLRPKLQSAPDDLRLVEDLAIDSLTMIEIVVLTEDVLHVSIDNEELVKLRTLGDVRKFIASKVGMERRS